MKKTTKRIRSAIVQTVIFNILFLLILGGILLYYIYPSIKDVTEKQNQLDEVMILHERIKKEGLTLKEFKSLYLNNKDIRDTYVVNLLKTIDEDFYSTNLTNTDYSTYSEFLEKKLEDITAKKSSNEFKKADERIRTIIPSYSDRPGIEGVISDYNFISYIEALLFTFNLQTSDSIGIGNLEPVVDTSLSIEKTGKKSTEESLFYIPLSFDLIGQKNDILDFLHFLENVGTINIIDGKIVPYNDKVIRKIIKGSTFGKDYNIYDNQLADIEYISMKEYIDTSPQPSDTDLILFIRDTQSRERFEIEIKTRFYVSGLPDYKVEASIDETVKNFSMVQKDISAMIAKNKDLSRTTKSGDILLAVNTIESLGFLLNSMKLEVSDLKKRLLKDKSNIENIYDDVIEIDNQVEKITSIFRENQKIIDTVK